MPAKLRSCVCCLLFLWIWLGHPQPASAQASPTPRVTVEVEAGPIFVTRNDARIPPDTGTGFSLLDLTGRGPDPFFRAYVSVQLAERHGLRLLAAPVTTSGTGTLSEPVFFVDREFAPGVPTKGTFKFNTYRLAYRYTLRSNERWQVQIGAAILVRDAKIELEQAGRTVRNTDLGFVPLACFSAKRHLTDRTSLVFDVEGLGSPQGRAIDAAVKVEHRLTSRWLIAAGYRTVEGGADVTAVYTFAWLHFGVLSLGYRF